MSSYTITIVALPSAVPSTIRLRRLLKFILRSYGFRCVGITEGDGCNGETLSDQKGVAVSGLAPETAPALIGRREVLRTRHASSSMASLSRLERSKLAQSTAIAPPVTPNGMVGD
jgi:hypothetical protein